MTAARPDSFLVHSVCDDSGVTSAFRYHLCAALIAVAEVNAAGGVLGRPMQVVEHQGQDATSARFAESLYQSGSRYLLGPNGSSLVARNLPATTPRQMLQAGWSNAGILGDARRYPFYFQPHFTDQQQALVFLSYLVRRRGCGRIGVLYERSPFGESALAAHRRLAGQLGVTVHAEAASLTAAHYHRQVTSLRRAGVDGLVLLVTPRPVVRAILCDLAENGWAPPLVGQSALLEGELFAGLPEASSADSYAISMRKLTGNSARAVAQRQTAYARQLRERLATQSGAGPHMGLPTHLLSPYYDWLHLVAAAVNEAGTQDTVVVRQVLETVTGHDGMIGDFTFGADSHTGIGLDDLTLASPVQVSRAAADPFGVAVEGIEEDARQLADEVSTERAGAR